MVDTSFYTKMDINSICWDKISKHPILTTLGLLYGANWLYCYLTCGVCKSKARLDGKTVIITGCTSGIGKATAVELARRGARVIMACRNLEKAHSVKEFIVKTTNNNNVVVRNLDVSLLESVREFAENINLTEARLDVLILNAGVVDSYKKKTSEGLNLVWATNHFGPFLLTVLLTDLLKRTFKARVVVVSSLAHKLGGVNPKNVNRKEEKSSVQLYCNTKFANVIFTKELATRLKGSGVTANSLHPGAIHTPIWNKNPLWIHLILYLIKPFFKTEEQGAQTTIYLSLSEEVDGVSGKYFSDCKEQLSVKKIDDADLAHRFWEACARVVELKHC